MTEADVAALVASVFLGIVDEKLPPCPGPEMCPFDRYCWSRWALLGDGRLCPYDVNQRRPDVWATWPSCPRLHLEHRVALGGETVLLAEACRWAVECGAHRRRLPARSAHLVRLWTSIHERPARWREHRSFEESKAKKKG